MPVIANNRTLVHAESRGTLCTLDICLTTPNQIPVPYLNIAKSKDATNCATSVFVNNNPICHLKSYFAESHGDECGTYGGIHSGTIKGKAEFITASPNIFVEGQPVTRQGDLMVSNNRNTLPEPLQQP